MKSCTWFGLYCFIMLLKYSRTTVTFIVSHGNVSSAPSGALTLHAVSLGDGTGNRSPQRTTRLCPSLHIGFPVLTKQKPAVFFLPSFSNWVTKLRIFKGRLCSLYSSLVFD